MTGHRLAPPAPSIAASRRATLPPMRTQLQVEPERPSLLRRVLALVILVAAAALAIHVVMGLLMAVVWLVLAVAVVLAVVWALKTLTW